MAYSQTHLPKGYMLYHDTFRIERVLGQGGFGITYLATDCGLDRKVAIKEFFPKEYCNRDETTSNVTVGTLGQKDFIDRLKAKFLKEARNIAKFDCANIIKIYSAFEENGTAYYAMEYIDGRSLSEIVKSDGAIDENQAITYIEKIGHALEYIHTRHINHLDVKPANIMLRESDNEPILIDFGLSKQYDAEGNQTSTTPTGISHGYAPMEQYNEGGVKEFSPQTDVYSLAATLYFLVSGKVPPRAMEVLNDGLSFPPSFPDNIKNAVVKAMSPAKKNRHETVGDFLVELKNAHVVFPSDCHEEPNTPLYDDAPLEVTVIDSPDNNITPPPVPSTPPEINAPYVYQKTKSTGHGCLIAFLIALGIGILLTIIVAIYNQSSQNDIYDYPSTESAYSYDEVNDNAAEDSYSYNSYNSPAAAPAPKAAYDYDDEYLNNYYDWAK